jgi:hypothetical protein
MHFLILHELLSERMLQPGQRLLPLPLPLDRVGMPEEVLLEEPLATLAGTAVRVGSKSVLSSPTKWRAVLLAAATAGRGESVPGETRVVTASAFAFRMNDGVADRAAARWAEDLRAGSLKRRSTSSDLAWSSGVARSAEHIPLSLFRIMLRMLLL